MALQDGLDVGEGLHRLDLDPARREVEGPRQDADLSREGQHIADADGLGER